MNKPDLTIIKSPEGEKMRQMVTEGFYDRSPIGLWMFEVMGREYDDMAQWARTMRVEAFPQTCTWSIAIWEFVHGIEPDDALPLDYRRQRLMAKILEHAPINPERIRQLAEAFTGADAEVIENAAPYTFKLALLPKGGTFVNYTELFRIICRLKPSHLTLLMDAFTNIPPVTVFAIPVMLASRHQDTLELDLEYQSKIQAPLPISVANYMTSRRRDTLELDLEYQSKIQAPLPISVANYMTSRHRAAIGAADMHRVEALEICHAGFHARIGTYRRIALEKELHIPQYL